MLDFACSVFLKSYDTPCHSLKKMTYHTIMLDPFTCGITTFINWNLFFFNYFIESKVLHYLGVEVKDNLVYDIALLQKTTSMSIDLGILWRLLTVVVANIIESLHFYDGSIENRLRKCVILKRFLAKNNLKIIHF